MVFQTPRPTAMVLAMRYKRLRRMVDWHLVFLLFLAPSARGEGGPGIHALAGDLRLELRCYTGGISLERLRDVRSGQDLTAPEPLPLFSVTLRDTHSANLTKLVADAGWRECSVRQRGRRLHLRWSKAEDAALAGLSIAATVNADATDNSLSWELRVDNAGTNWSVWRVVFPQLALADLGSNAAVLFPRGPGEVQRGVWGRPFTYRGSYANGWCSMQFVAAYRESESPTGLYVGLHDPWGSVKDLALVSEPKIRDVHLSFEHPAPGMGLPQNSFVLSGKTVWRLLRGDWFDATMVYKQWARREAKCCRRPTSCAGHAAPVQRHTFSPSSRTTRAPQAGHFSGKRNSRSAPVRRSGKAFTTSGMTSPARRMSTQSPMRTSLRRSSSSLCSVARATSTPPMRTGSMSATGVTTPVRPTEN